jgi:hypothetical protein
MKRRAILAAAVVSATGVLAGCTGDDGSTDSPEDSETESPAEETTAYDFSSCEHELDENTVRRPLENLHNDPTASPTVSVDIGYREDISDADLSELDDIVGGNLTHLESSQAYAGGRDFQIHKCTVAELSQKSYVEYIIPNPQDVEN